MNCYHGQSEEVAFLSVGVPLGAVSNGCKILQFLHYLRAPSNF